MNLQEQIPGVATSAAPTLAVVGTTVYLAWKGEGTDSGIYWRNPLTYDPNTNGQYSWHPQTMISNVGTSDSPAIASFNGNLYMSWKGEGNDFGLYFSKFDGATWTPQTKLQGGTSNAPSLVGTSKGLFMAWKAEPGDNRLFWSIYDGNKWQPQQQVPGVGGTSDAPTLAAFGNTVYLAWKALPGDNRIFWSMCTNGATWAPQKPVIGIDGTDVGPALACQGDGEVWLAWKDANSENIYYCHLVNSSNNEWSAPVIRPGVLTSSRPSLIMLGGRNGKGILMVWKGESGDSGIYYGWLRPQQYYNFGIGKVNIITQRSRNTETDSLYLSLSVKVGSNPPFKNTKALGDHVFHDVFDANLNVNAEFIADDEKVVMSYIMINHGGSSSSAQIMSSLEGAVVTLGKAAMTAYAAAVGVALNILLPGFGAAITAAAGPLVAAIEGWVVSAVSGIWDKIVPDCDGPVAGAFYTFTGSQLRTGNQGPIGPLGSLTIKTDNCVGTNSPAGCGDNSLYDVSWVVTAP